jgi:hypothetical protein
MRAAHPVACSIALGGGDDAAGLKAPKGQLQRPLGCLQVPQLIAKVSRVIALRWQLHVVEVGDGEPRLDQTSVLRQGTRAPDGGLRQIEAGGFARCDQAREAAGEGTGATAEINQTHARAKIWRDKRGILPNR